MGNSTATVLVVDDEERVADVYAEALAGEYAVETAYCGRGALSAVDESVDVVLLDRRMGDLPGREVLERIRGRGLDVRVAMLSAVDPDFDVVDMPFDDYLVKPVSPDAIGAAVEELLALSRHDDQARESFRVARKVAALEGEKTAAELAASDRYDDLLARQADLDARMTARVAERDDAFFVSSATGPGVAQD